MGVYVMGSALAYDELSSSAGLFRRLIGLRISFHVCCKSMRNRIVARKARQIALRKYTTVGWGWQRKGGRKGCNNAANDSPRNNRRARVLVWGRYSEPSYENRLRVTLNISKQKTNRSPKVQGLPQYCRLPNRREIMDRGNRDNKTLQRKNSVFGDVIERESVVLRKLSRFHHLKRSDFKSCRPWDCSIKSIHGDESCISPWPTNLVV